MTQCPAADSYAKALLLLTSDGKQLMQRLEQLEKFQKVLESNPKFFKLLEAPDRQTEDRQKLLESLLADSQDPLLLRFMDILLEKKRLDCLDDIIRLYRISANRVYGIQVIKAITAKPMEKEQLDALNNKLKEMFPNKTIELSMQIDPSVIGGLALIIDNKIIDGTIKGELSKLKEKLLALSV